MGWKVCCSATAAISLKSRVPGAGLGANCLPKDIEVLAAKAGELGYDAKLLRSALEVSLEQLYAVVRLSRKPVGNLHGRRMAGSRPLPRYEGSGLNQDGWEAA